MSLPKSKHQVFIFRNDYNALCTEVYLRQNVATGGNLFGLWRNFGSAVVHVVLGPGQHCKRTRTSFQQDVEYMNRVNRFVDDRYSLCHIGEWRSHHNLSLKKPSTEDEHDIKRIFPQGMSKFLVIIANIKNGDTIKLSSYFFTDGGQRYRKAEYVVLESDSLFSTDDRVLAHIEHGAELSEFEREIDTENQENDSLAGYTGQNCMQNTDESGFKSVTTTCQQVTSARGQNRGEGKESAPKPNPRLPGALVNLSTSKSQLDSSSSDSLINRRKHQSQVNNITVSHYEPTPNHDEEPMDTDQSDLYPPRDHDEPSASHMSVTTDSQQDTSVRGEGDPEKDIIVDEEPQSERKIILDQIHDHLKYWFGIQTKSMFKYETSKNTPGADEITFKHNSKYWMVRFPKDFPSNPAKLFYSYWDSHLPYHKYSDYDLVKPLTNKESILLSIKKNCGLCKVCEHITSSFLNPRSTVV